MNTALGFPFGFFTNDDLPQDGKYFNRVTKLPYASIAEATGLVLMPLAVRHKGLTLNIAGDEYWWKDGIQNDDLVEKNPLVSFNPATIDLDEFLNESSNPFVRENMPIELFCNTEADTHIHVSVSHSVLISELMSKDESLPDNVLTYLVENIRGNYYNVKNNMDIPIILQSSIATANYFNFPNNRDVILPPEGIVTLKDNGENGVLLMSKNWDGQKIEDTIIQPITIERVGSVLKTLQFSLNTFAVNDLLEMDWFLFFTGLIGKESQGTGFSVYANNIPSIEKAVLLKTSVQTENKFGFRTKIVDFSQDKKIIERGFINPKVILGVSEYYSIDKDNYIMLVLDNWEVDFNLLSLSVITL